MADPTPRAREIAAAARELLEEEGPEALSMRRVAERVGLKAPTLYKHLPGKRALEAAVIAQAFEEQAVAFEAALAEGGLPAIARAYRRWANEHPHLYRLTTEGPLPREHLPDGLEARTAAPVVAAVGGDGDVARAAWAFAHGMTVLELDDRFPPGADLDAAWERGLRAFTA